jgi:hypothetical protein
MQRAWIALPAAFLLLTGCVIEHAGPTLHDSQAIERDSSDVVQVDVEMGAGTLRVEGGTDKLATADFAYAQAAGKPEMRFTSAGGHGHLTIRQSRPHSFSTGNDTNRWDVRLNRDIPIDMNAHLGAGEVRLRLGDLTLSNLAIDVGAGELDLDLRGSPKKSYDVHVNGGVGEARIHLPRNVGIEARAQGGIGSVDASGLQHDGGRYYNSTSSPVTIHLDVQGGVGNIKLMAE